MPAPVLDAASARAYQRMAADLRRVFGGRFVALVAGGSGSSAAFASRIDADDLQALGALVDMWARDRLAPPLLMTPEEFRRSLDTFPAEYQALIDHHVVVDGIDPLAGATVNLDDLRRACEAQARGHLIHLRQGWLEQAAHEHGLSELIEQSAGPLRQVLTNLARLDGESIADDGALADFAGRRTGMHADLVAAILNLVAAPDQAAHLVPRLPEYLAATERLWTFIDTWRAR